jgi:CHASE3 domain sensor protein
VLDKAEKSLQDTNKQAIGVLKNRIQELDKATNRLNWQFIALYSSAFVALVMVVFLAIFLFIPSSADRK